jgi:hypothetical protein
MPKTHLRALLAFALYCIYSAPPACAEHEHASNVFEVFYAAEGIYATGQSHPASDDDTYVNADILFAAASHQFRVLGELFVSPREHDLERMQFGYEFAPDTVLWVGRFHMPASAWNSEHHHGRYLQTSITRPFIERWEDEHGLIPQHITGALFETRQSIGSASALQFAAGAGAGPSWGDHQYEPIDLIGENPGRHRLSLSTRLAYLPEYEGASSAGLLFAHDQFYSTTPQIFNALNSAHVVLSIAGAYIDWSFSQWRVMGATYYVDVNLDETARSESFTSGYLQVERVLSHDLTAFGRIEDSARMQDSRYVALFDDHDGDFDVALRRQALGLRWDFIRRQALTIELSHVATLGQRSNEVRLQWSGVIP